MLFSDQVDLWEAPRVSKDGSRTQLCCLSAPTGKAVSAQSLGPCQYSEVSFENKTYAQWKASPRYNSCYWLFMPACCPRIEPRPFLLEGASSWCLAAGFLYTSGHPLIATHTLPGKTWACCLPLLLSVLLSPGSPGSLLPCSQLPPLLTINNLPSLGFLLSLPSQVTNISPGGASKWIGKRKGLVLPHQVICVHFNKSYWKMPCLYLPQRNKSHDVHLS